MPQYRRWTECCQKPEGPQGKPCTALQFSSTSLNYFFAHIIFVSFLLLFLSPTLYSHLFFKNPILQGRVIVRRLDLADFKSIKDFVQSLDTFEKIHVLVCNAGVAGAPFGFTKQGFEMHMGVNHFSHFYLTQLLLPKLRAAGTKNDPARIIVVSSVNAGFVKLDNRYWDDPKWEKRAYIYGMAYSESKLANIYMANELARRASIEDAPIVAYSLHPGLVRTSLLRYGRWNDGCMGCIASMCGKSAQQGAATAVWAVVTPEIPTGSFLENCAVAKPLTKNTKQARECWERTEDIIANALAEMSEKSKGINE